MNNKVQILMWCNSVLAVIGTFLNAKKVRFGFILWMVTNAVFVISNFYIGVYPQAALFAVYFGLSVYGWLNWGKEKTNKKTQEDAPTT